MKRTYLPAALMCAALLSTSCGTTQNAGLLSTLGQTALNTSPSSSSDNTSTEKAETGKETTTGSLIGSLLGNLLGGSEKLSVQAIAGKWNYEAPDCVFESENLLMKAGGEIAAKKVENEISQQLGKVGIKKGGCTFEFNEDGTYTATIGRRKLTGKYELNAENKTVKMTYLSGLATMEPRIVLSGGELSLLYESDKLLKLVSAISSLSGNSAGQTLGKVIGAYDGLYVGVKLSK